MNVDPRNIVQSIRKPIVSHISEGAIAMPYFEGNIEYTSISGVTDKFIADMLSIDKEKIWDSNHRLVEEFEEILDDWMTTKEMAEFFILFRLPKEYQDYYVRYFGSKILHFLLFDIIDAKKNIDKTYFITTKFFAFLKNHDLSIDTLSGMLMIMKSVIFQRADTSIETYKYITTSFDIINILLSKNFSDLILRLLGEYRNTIDVSSIVSKTDIFGAITYVNQSFCDVSGYTKEELLGRSHNIVRHPDTPKETFKDLWDTIQDKKIWRNIIKNRSKDGSSRWYQTTIVPIVDEMENILEYICIRSDITELKFALKNAEEYSNALNSSNLIIRFLPGGNIFYVNEAFEKFSGFKARELVGRNLLEQAGKLYFPHNENNETSIKFFVEDIREHLAEGKIWQGVIRIRTKNKTNTWCATTIIPIFDSENKIAEYIVVQTDITDIELSKQNLRASYEKLQVLDKQKDEFLNIASHELRTPMTSVRGYISMILDGDTGEIGPETRLYLERVLGSSTRLLSLINDMLDIAKLESGQSQFMLEKIDIKSFLKDCYDETLQLFKQKQQKLTLEVGFEHLVVQLDRSKLLQVFINLLGNAQKFTPEKGTIHIKAETENHILKIHIIDDGIGIKKVDLKRIFEKFQQAKGSLTRNISGTGLGLPIARNIIEQMGGQLQVESEPGKGSDFIVEIPILEK